MDGDVEAQGASVNLVAGLKATMRLYMLTGDAKIFASPNVKFQRLIASVYLLLFIAAVSAFGVFFWQTRQEYHRLQEAESRAQVRLAEIQERVREQERVLERLRTDPGYVETVIRRRLGYAKPDEMIFRFRDP